jgi:hypothetical protein
MAFRRGCTWLRTDKEVTYEHARRAVMAAGGYLRSEAGPEERTCEPGGIRTHDQGIKSPLLYR